MMVSIVLENIIDKHNIILPIKKTLIYFTNTFKKLSGKINRNKKNVDNKKNNQ